MNAGEISVGPNCKITFHFKVSGQQEIQRQPQMEIRAPWKQSYLRGICRVLNIWSSSYRAAVGLNLLWEVKPARGLSGYVRWLLKSGVWWERKGSIMGAKRGQCKGSKNRIRGNLALKQWADGCLEERNLRVILVWSEGSSEKLLVDCPRSTRIHWRSEEPLWLLHVCQCSNLDTSGVIVGVSTCSERDGEISLSKGWLSRTTSAPCLSSWNPWSSRLRV